MLFDISSFWCAIIGLNPYTWLKAVETASSEAQVEELVMKDPAKRTLGM